MRLRRDVLLLSLLAFVLGACGLGGTAANTSPNAVTAAPSPTGVATIERTQVGGAATPGPVPSAAGTTAVQVATTNSAAQPTAGRIEASPVPCPVPAGNATSDCEKLYQTLLAKYGEDYSTCQVQAAPVQACQKPASLETELKQQVNIQLMLDASGSMAEKVDGRRKMDIAKDVMTRFVDTVPKQANVGLRVYGQAGSNAEKDKAFSCSRSDFVYAFAPLDPARFKSAIASFDATGWTPIAASLQAAQQDFAPYDAAKNTNIIYLVSDGIETCDGDPVAAAKALHESNIGAIVNIVGFNVDNAATAQLKAAAEAGGGKYYEARSADELDRVFTQQIDWKAWNQYYGCVVGAANQQAGTTFGEQNRSAGCTFQKANKELGAIFADLNTNAAAYGACYKPVSDRVKARHAKITSAKDSDYDQVIGEAKAEYEQALQQAGQEFDGLQQTAAPQP